MSEMTSGLVERATVPIKPTEAMLRAGIYCDDLIHLGNDAAQMRALRLIWLAMLEAAPRAPLPAPPAKDTIV